MRRTILLLLTFLLLTTLVIVAEGIRPTSSASTHPATPTPTFATPLASDLDRAISLQLRTTQWRSAVAAAVAEAERLEAERLEAERLEAERLKAERSEQYTSHEASVNPEVVVEVESGDVWDRLAQCESGGNWAANTGNGYYGGLQFSLGSWQGVGGTGRPDQASRETQIAMGQRLQAQGGWGHWPACSSHLGLR